MTTVVERATLGAIAAWVQANFILTMAAQGTLVMEDGVSFMIGFRPVYEGDTNAGKLGNQPCESELTTLPQAPQLESSLLVFAMATALDFGSQPMRQSVTRTGEVGMG